MPYLHRTDTGEPLVLPRPKQIRFSPDSAPFRINASTRIVRIDESAGGRKAAALLQAAINEAFGLALRNVSAMGAVDREVADAAIYVGLGESFPRQARVITPDKPEGYGVMVDRACVQLAGRDEAGILWAAQTLIQLLNKDANGPFIPVTSVQDWPTLSLRAVHLFHGRNALPFHQKLIDRVLSRFKMNAVFIQAEQIRWDADPRVAPDWAGHKADLASEITFARMRGMVVYPLLESYGHMEWLFSKGRNQSFAEDPETPYAVSFTNPKAVAYLDRFNAEADTLFGAPGFHVGLDEVTMRGRFPFASGPRRFSDLFVAGAKHWHTFFARRNKQLWMWADMAIHPSEVAPCFGTAPSPEEARRVRAGLPKDIVMVDWQYSAHPRYPSLDLLKKEGFANRVAATWHDREGIQNFARAAAQNQAMGAMQTTWAGYESSEKVLSTSDRKQFTAMVVAADYFWNGGDGPPPAHLPYDAEVVFARQWQ